MVPSKPLPTSKPLVAGIDSMALARSASSRSKTGAPRPGGRLRMRQRIIPPTESPWERMSLIRAIMRSAVSG